MKNDPRYFDRAYYERFYGNPKTRVLDPEYFYKLGQFVCSYIGYLELPVKRVLDIGCGLGLWKELVEWYFPGAKYHGVEYGDYLCKRCGWERGSVVDYRSRRPFDFVICQSVLPYLDARSARRAIENLGALCRGVLYLEAVTSEDLEQDVVDVRRMDRTMILRSERWYRKCLRSHFIFLGGGVWLSRRAGVPMFALERGD